MIWKIGTPQNIIFCTKYIAYHKRIVHKFRFNFFHVWRFMPDFIFRWLIRNLNRSYIQRFAWNSNTTSIGAHLFNPDALKNHRQLKFFLKVYFVAAWEALFGKATGVNNCWYFHTGFYAKLNIYKRTGDLVENAYFFDFSFAFETVKQTKAPPCFMLQPLSIQHWIYCCFKWCNRIQWLCSI